GLGTRTHAYAAAGLFTVRVTVTDKDGGSDTKTFQVNVTGGKPTAFVVGPADGVRGQTRTFTLSASDPTPANQAAGFVYAIDRDAGRTRPVAGTAGNGAGVSVGHVFTEAGSYTVRVTATNQAGLVSDAAARTIIVSVMAVQVDPPTGEHVLV